MEVEEIVQVMVLGVAGLVGLVVDVLHQDPERTHAVLLIPIRNIIQVSVEAGEAGAGREAVQGLNRKEDVPILVLEKLKQTTNIVSVIADTEVVTTIPLLAPPLVVVEYLNVSIVTLVVTRFGRTRVLLVRRRIIARIILIQELLVNVVIRVVGQVRNLHPGLQHRKLKLRQKQNANVVHIALVEVLIVQIKHLVQEVKTGVLIREHIPERSLEVEVEKILLSLVLPHMLMLRTNVYAVRHIVIPKHKLLPILIVVGLARMKGTIPEHQKGLRCQEQEAVHLAPLQRVTR